MSNTPRGHPLTSSRVEQIFPKLMSAQINRIAAHGHVRVVQRGEVLVEQGMNKSIFFRSCHHTCKENRKKNKFECIKCGYIEMADYVAAINIAVRASVNEPHSSTSFYGSYKPRGFSTHA